MRTAILHYSAPPVVGGVETVMHAHAGLLLKNGFPVTVIAGVGEVEALPHGTEMVRIPEMDSRHPEIERLSRELDAGRVPLDFNAYSRDLEERLEEALHGFDCTIVHNIFSKHFNLPLTAALCRLVQQQKVGHCFAWVHDASWTSPHSRGMVHEGYPWDLLRTLQAGVTYVAVSQKRKDELVGLFGCRPEQIRVIYNGVEPGELYGLSEEGRGLVERLDLDAVDLVLLMPLRITQAKNIEFALQVVACLKRDGVTPRLVITGPPDPHDQGDIEYYHHLLDIRRDLDVEEEVRFVYGSGPEEMEGYIIGPGMVGELYHVCDVLFMPSHREGFGMPILEAGLLGRPVFSTQIPAALEVGDGEVYTFESGASPEAVARLITQWADASRTHKLRVRVRRDYTWQAIFDRHILPLLTQGYSP